MKIYITEECNDDYNQTEITNYEISTPNNELSFGNMEPEDANLNRDLNCVFCIPDMLQEAFDAGKNGEDFTIVYKN